MLIFHTQKNKILKNVNISIKKNKVALRGISGSGKTSLVNLICGLLRTYKW